jgi:hypothetical protein
MCIKTVSVKGGQYLLLKLMKQKKKLICECMEQTSKLN